MEKIKYIYYEITRIVGNRKTEEELINVNVLLIEPHTNSSGVWGFTHRTERSMSSKRKGIDPPEFLTVHQNWIDLEKFNNETHSVYGNQRKEVSKALKIINTKLRKGKIKKIMENG